MFINDFLNLFFSFVCLLFFLFSIQEELFFPSLLVDDNKKRYAFTFMTQNNDFHCFVVPHRSLRISISNISKEVGLHKSFCIADEDEQLDIQWTNTCREPLKKKIYDRIFST